MIKTVVFYIVTLVLTVLDGLTGCGQDKTLSGPERAPVLGFSEAVMDNLFTGLTANGYALPSLNPEAAQPAEPHRLGCRSLICLYNIMVNVQITHRQSI